MTQNGLFPDGPDLILGTASFKESYGISNQNEALSSLNSICVMQEARRMNIISVDTAPAYGEAEELVGSFNRKYGEFQCYTKISSIDADEAMKSLESSIHTLGIQKLKGVYFHNHKSLLEASKSKVFKTINSILDSELSASLGVSIYTEEDIEKINDKYPEIRLFQVPENILDRRLLNSPLVNSMAQAGYKFIVRSIFLQGLLLMEPGDIPRKISKVKPHIENLEMTASHLGTTRLNLCLNYACSIPWASDIILGFAVPSQITALSKYSSLDLKVSQYPGTISSEFCDPRNW